MTMLRDELRKLVDDMLPDGDTDVWVNAIMKLVEKYTTDATDPGEYEKTCAYCNRPAHHTYG